MDLSAQATSETPLIPVLLEDPVPVLRAVAVAASMPNRWMPPRSVAVMQPNSSNRSPTVGLPTMAVVDV